MFKSWKKKNQITEAMTDHGILTIPTIPTMTRRKAALMISQAPTKREQIAKVAN
jgi:hypothetical protein